MKYYVLAGIGLYEPTITEHDSIEEAKKEYRTKIQLYSDVRIARDLKVTIEIIEDQEVEIRQ